MEHKVLIIYAHPHRNGFSGAMLEEIKKDLHSRGQESTLLDLYKSDFNPVLSSEELGTQSSKFVAPTTRKMQDLISKSNKIIFIYPTWWQNMPAILKGFVDKVFSSNFAFKFEGKKPVGLLTGKKAVILTSSGAPSFVSRYIYGNRVIKVLKKDVLSFCGIKSKGFIVGGATDLSKYDKLKISKIAKKAMNYLL